MAWSYYTQCNGCMHRQDLLESYLMISLYRHSTLNQIHVFSISTKVVTLVSNKLYFELNFRQSICAQTFLIQAIGIMRGTSTLWGVIVQHKNSEGLLILCSREFMTNLVGQGLVRNSSEMSSDLVKIITVIRTIGEVSKAQYGPFFMFKTF